VRRLLRERRTSRRKAFECIYKSLLEVIQGGKIKMADDNNGSDKLVYFLIGAGIGAVTALLFAPKPGSELRADLADATRKGLDQARDTTRELNERANEVYQTGVERAADLAARSKEAVNDLTSRSKETVTELTERSKELVNRQKSQIQAALEAGKQGYMEAKQSDQAKAAFDDNV
jgi:gas vesicle protein